MPLVLGSWMLTTTGVGQEAPEPEPEVVVEQPRGRAAWLADLPRRERSREEISRDRERFGLIDDEAREAIAEVAARQAERDEQDEQKRFDELYRELELRKIGFDARYLEALTAMREEMVRRREEQQKLQLLRENDDMLLLMLLAAAAAA